MAKSVTHRALFVCTLSLGMTSVGCAEGSSDPALAEGIYARLGEAIPDASPQQHADFAAGLEVANRRFYPGDGLGPTGNVSFCGACHEKPVTGGSGPRYRDFYLHGTALAGGGFIPGDKNGVLTAYGYHGADVRPLRDPDANVVSHRNATPFFGAGLIAEINEEKILDNEDEDDVDGDGISGRANYDRGFVGRFGRKAQTVSIEGFIRGPLFNHLGITTDPLPESLRERLPVFSPVEDRAQHRGPVVERQAAAPDEPLSDDDGVPDPEMSADELFTVISFTMLLAAPQPDDPTDASERGHLLFDEIGCNDCHIQALEGPRGLIPLYSDLLLHDMGDEMADGVEMQLASGREFRTQPLWGVAATAPYLHDGRADTLDGAIRRHGGEGERSRENYEALTDGERQDVIAFLESLGGVDQRTPGLLPPLAGIPQAGEPGAPVNVRTPEERERWLAGRALFDRDTPIAAGLGPKFNGDSCRACHFDPVIGGAGPLDVNVMRYGTEMGDEFIAPEGGTILHKLTTVGLPRPEYGTGHNVFEPRQTPTTMGLGFIEAIAEETIVAGADPDDLDGDGIRGIAHVLPDGRIGRFGWKAQVPSIYDFVRDAMTAEIGLTVPPEDGFSYGLSADDDEIPDPELTVEEIDTMAFFLGHLDYPRPKRDVSRGLEVFAAAGCDGCHTPELPSSEGPVPLYSDLLLHDVAPAGATGITDFAATRTQFRTAPLWGLSDTAPYMHDGAATTVRDAILAHFGEAEASRMSYESLSPADQATLVEFLESL